MATEHSEQQLLALEEFRSHFGSPGCMAPLVVHVATGLYTRYHLANIAIFLASLLVAGVLRMILYAFMFKKLSIRVG
ncbi:hypothetical protein OBBRIDRAFT_840355 [Obba rivulosa]|uniref:Uncharacterized protein n=1 Tax=Obba rivulosa TaxID=1052685 RepID=A0A8E2DDD5_9APHY|nr:hypothetical protein OBBRIDRAFT_840355 [Obba rivulosa]